MIVLGYGCCVLVLRAGAGAACWCCVLVLVPGSPCAAPESHFAAKMPEVNRSRPALNPAPSTEHPARSTEQLAPSVMFQDRSRTWAK
jgi:hypothetical protein